MLDRVFLGFAGIILILLLVVVTFAPWLQTHDPLLQDFAAADQGLSAEHWLGTDEYGRDIFSRLVEGARLSMTIGVAAPLIAAIIGISLGTSAAFFGGWTETVVTRVTDVMMSFDPLLLGVLIVALLGPGVQNLSIAIAAALVPSFCRLSRASALSVKREAYVDASIAMGRGSFGTIWLHVLPNIAGPLVVMLTIWIGSAIRLEASLSFIGLGAQAPAPSWGNMVREGVADIFGSPLPAIFAGLAITLSVLAFNIIGDRLRDRLDPDRVGGR
ncbi:ABC transporter permease [Bosea sp. BK604]|uniref:ABC transporter permease n=1 Tax=Bosea sp. BK604 TaxID=2512180 RepID=UPI001045EC7C|nr:ABC transporter permease [Bosea sp. BK604]TCR63082.1 peptide/nickel transport system permease protein/glutathione transport system permease protein [Bosea sp. BK604]